MTDEKTTGNKSKKPGLIKRLRARLNKGDSWLTYDLANLVPGGKIDEAVLEELETRLVVADVGVDTTDKIITAMRTRLARKELADVDALMGALAETLTDMLKPVDVPLRVDDDAKPWVVLVVGVNGAGKTTTLGKLAKRLKADGRSVMLAAGDTFRAAAIEQLEAWGARNDVPVIAQATGADPAAVAFDACEAARAREVDVLLIDTAGRLQNQAGLMDELRKIQRVVGRALPGAPHEVLLVIDGGLGQNALVQAEQFHAALGLTGLVVTKLDGSAKGGIVFAIADATAIPVRFIGIGEKAEDLQPFDAGAYAAAIVGGELRGAE